VVEQSRCDIEAGSLNIEDQETVSTTTGGVWFLANPA